MIPEPVQLALAIGFAALLFLLRLDSRRFGAAEWDDDRPGTRRWVGRAGWLAMGLALVLLIFVFHPQPISRLHLELGPDRLAALLLGLLYGVVGAVVAVVFARLRYGALRPPPSERYPVAVVTAVAIAVIDEVLFRGVILGTLLGLRLQPWAAILIAAAIAVVTIRAAGGPQGLGVLLITFLTGVVGGVLVMLTDGLGAGIVGLAMMRLALFATTGRRGRWLPPRFEMEEREGIVRPPVGWEFVPGQEDRPLDYRARRPG